MWHSGSHDDKALNAGAERFTADPTAVRDLSYDSDLTGKVSIPVLTMHPHHPFHGYPLSPIPSLRSAGEGRRDLLSSYLVMNTKSSERWCRRRRRRYSGSICSRTYPVRSPRYRSRA